MITDARNPKWENSQHATIVLQVQLNGNWIDYVAAPDDSVDLGSSLFHLALNGKFGEIAESDEEQIIAGEMPPPEGCVVRDGIIVNVAALELQVTAELNRRLAELNSEVSRARAEVDEEYAAKRRADIIALLAVKEQPEWPFEIEWPE